MKSFVVVAGLLTASLPALAHISMLEPTPRFDDGNNKWCPCGTGGDGSRANNGCAISKTDPNRGATSNTFAPGSTITVRWRESVAHTGRMRISFDPDGADQDDFDQHILADLPDPSGAGDAVGGDNIWEEQVTLPNTPCDNCTLQVIQVMNGDTADPVPTPTNSYFQCANLVLSGDPAGEGEGDVGEGEGEGEGDGGGGGGGPACSSTSSAPVLPALLLLALAIRRRSRS